MRRRTLSTTLLVAAVALGPIAAGARDDGRGEPLRAVVHVNFHDTGRQGHGLKNVANILREVGDDGAEIEVVCHGAGIGLLEKARTEHAAEVADPIRRGVRLAARENTRRRNGLRKDDLLPGVGTVPSGALEVVRKQGDGYACFKP